MSTTREHSKGVKPIIIMTILTRVRSETYLPVNKNFVKRFFPLLNMKPLKYSS